MIPRILLQEWRIKDFSQKRKWRIQECEVPKHLRRFGELFSCIPDEGFLKINPQFNHGLKIEIMKAC